MKRVKIQPSQAAEFLALGYEIEVYALLPDPSTPTTTTTTTTTTRRSTTRVNSNEKVIPSVDGQIPVRGKSAEIWPLLHEYFWGKDLLKPACIKDVQARAVHLGGTRNMVSNYIHKSGCLRVVTDG